MNIEEAHSFDEFAEANAGRWRRIVSSSSVATIYQTWEWTEAWWRHFGHGKRLWALRFVEDGETVGYCALCFPARAALVRTARFVGAGLSDYSDLIAAPGREEAVADAFRAFLLENRSRWDWIDLQQVRPDAVAERLLQPAAGVRAGRSRGKACMYVPLASSWEAFRKSLTSKMRENVNRQIRIVDTRHGGEFRLATAETLPADLEAFFDLHTRRWNDIGAPGLLASDRIRAFHREVAAALLAAGMLRLHVLSVDGRPGAISYNFQKGAVRYGYLTGFDPSFTKLSLGLVVVAHTIRHAIEADRAVELDLAQGDEAYKYRWGGVDRAISRLSLTRRGVRSAVPAFALRTFEEQLQEQVLLPMRRAGIRPRRLAYQLRTMLSPAPRPAPGTRSTD